MIGAQINIRLLHTVGMDCPSHNNLLLEMSANYSLLLFSPCLKRSRKQQQPNQFMDNVETSSMHKNEEMQKKRLVYWAECRYSFEMKCIQRKHQISFH